MGVIYVHDKAQPQGTQLPTCSHGLTDRLFVQFVPLDPGPYGQPDGTPKTDRFTDSLGKIGTEGIAQIFGKRHELRVNEANVSSGWKTARVTVQDIEHDAVDVPIERVGSGPIPPQPPGLTTVSCPHNGSVKGAGTPDEWKVIAHRIVDTMLPPGAIMEPDTGPQPNLDKFDAELRKVHPNCHLQFSSGGKKKPRIFFPSSLLDGKGPPESPCGQYSRVTDIGGFGQPFFTSTDGTETDVWSRPYAGGSQW